MQLSGFSEEALTYLFPMSTESSGSQSMMSKDLDGDYSRSFIIKSGALARITIINHTGQQCFFNTALQVFFRLDDNPDNWQELQVKEGAPESKQDSMLLGF